MTPPVLPAHLLMGFGRVAHLRRTAVCVCLDICRLQQCSTAVALDNLYGATCR